jgi:hypothetical protein
MIDWRGEERRAATVCTRRFCCKLARNEVPLLRVMRSHGVVDSTLQYIVVLEGRTCNKYLLLVAMKPGLVHKSPKSPLNFQHE